MDHIITLLLIFSLIAELIIIIKIRSLSQEFGGNPPSSSHILKFFEYAYTQSQNLTEETLKFWVKAGYFVFVIFLGLLILLVLTIL